MFGAMFGVVFGAMFGAMVERSLGIASGRQAWNYFKNIKYIRF